MQDPYNARELSPPSMESLREELEKTRADLQHAREQIAWMETSRFWKLRKLWWKLRGRVSRGGYVPALLRPQSEDGRSWWTPGTRPLGPPPRDACVDVFVLETASDTRALDSVTRRSRPPVRVDRTASPPDLARLASSSSAPYLALVDAPVEVPEEWLERLVAVLEAEPQAMAVTPLSRGIPGLAESWDRARSDFPSFAEFAAQVAADSARVRPVACSVPSGLLLVRRAAFGTPFVDVTSLACSIAERGGDVLLADDVAVERRGEAESAGAGSPGRVLAGIAGRLRGVAARREARAAAARFEGKRVLFVLPVKDRGGGANVVFREARSMVEMGVDARVVNLRENGSVFRRSYPEPDVPVTFLHPAEIPALARDFDAVVATANNSVEWLVPLAKDAAPVLGYYVQDFEPYFYPSGSAGHGQALASYSLIPRLVRFAKTEWNAREVEARCGVGCAVVGASLDTSVFGPRQPRMPVPPLRIAAMVRPSSPRRQPELTLQVLEEVWRRHGRDVEIALFGETREVDGRPIRANFPHRHVGMLDAEGLARLFNEIHVFADFSSYQAMGLTALEAMACGAAVIVPRAGGAAAFAVDGRNALVVDTTSAAACVAALSKLVEKPSLAGSLGDRALADVTAFTPDAAALRILEALFPRA